MEPIVTTAGMAATPPDEELRAAMLEPADPDECDAIASDVLDRLAAAGFVERVGPFPTREFRDFDTRVRASFEVPHTTMTPLTRRVLFGLTAAHRPTTALVLGCFVGYAAAYVFGPALGPDRRYDAAELLACDVFAAAAAQARANLGQVAGDAPVRVETADAADLLARRTDPIDLLYLDVDSDAEGKGAYTRLLEAALPLLSPGALVLAHDVTHPYYEGDVVPYLALVRDTSRFRHTATLRLDPCGLEVTVR